MSVMSVVPSIEPVANGFVLRIRALGSNQKWFKRYAEEVSAYVEALSLGLVADGAVSNEEDSSAVRKPLKPEVSMDLDTITWFGFQEELQ